MTITDFCQETRNWFDVKRKFGTFKIEGGTIDLDFLSEGQYFRIEGSVFNNGVHQFKAYDLKDELFFGSVWAMAVPQAVLDLIDKINDWESKNKKILDSPYQSESFGGYSYSKDSNADGWQSHFRKELNRWRKI